MTEAAIEDSVMMGDPLSEAENVEQVGEEDLSALSVEELRERKDEADANIIADIAKRQLVTDEIGKRKLQVGQPVHVRTEEYRILKRTREAAIEAGLNPNTVASLYENLFVDSRARQSEQRRRLGATALGGGASK